VRTLLVFAEGRSVKFCEVITHPCWPSAMCPPTRLPLDSSSILSSDLRLLWNDRSDPDHQHAIDRF
jgi:hypothetical protein